MIVYNITFHIDNKVHDEALDYLKKEYIPQVATGGFLHTPCLRKIMHAAEDEGFSYAVQFHVKNMDSLNYWLMNDGRSIHESLTKRFGDKIAGFTTVLEEIDWEQ